MNKMIKGAAFAGIGVALLLGGGGTLAVWNDKAEVDAGTIATGDLKLEARQGFWTKDGSAIDITNYRVVPGETLKFTQPLDVTVTGEALKAKLAISGLDLGAHVVLDGPYLSGPAGEKLSESIIQSSPDPQTLTATATFSFREGIGGRDGAAQEFKLDGVAYTLTQLPNN